MVDFQKKIRYGKQEIHLSKEVFLMLKGKVMVLSFLKMLLQI
jgi:hypothetical protein